MKCFQLVIFLVCSLQSVRAGSSVKLSDIQVLTLYHGKVTNGRRSSPVPQLKCVGGTAGCRAFTPQVVQCYNRGWDGNDIQWECKTDMDNAYRFGQISVSCEGYSYPDDPYILKGSCGLEYTIDLTKEGFDKQQGPQDHDYYGNAYNSNDKKKHYPESKGSFSLGSVILFAAFGLVIYGLYKTCLAPPSERVFQSSTTSDDFGGYPGGDPFRANAPPPPPGFRPEFMQNAGASPGASCGGQQTGFGSSSGRTGNGAGGFWTGAATGGLLGYMFGSRNNAGTAHTYRTRGNDYSDNQFWGGTTRRTSGSSSGGGSSSSGTRTASGFGGTSRR